MTRTKNVKKKVEAVFDEQKRKEFLTGFRKRKNDRRTRAKKELERNLKEERKQIKKEVRDGLKHLKKSFEPLRELTKEDKERVTELEDDNVTVKIVELSMDDLCKGQHFLGSNQSKEEVHTEEDNDESTDCEEELDTNNIPGMSITVAKKAATHETDEESEHSVRPLHITSKKELDRLKKKRTSKQLKKGKMFKRKEQLDKLSNQKKIKRERNNMLKSLPKRQRMAKMKEISQYHKGRKLNKKQLRQKRQSRKS